MCAISKPSFSISNLRVCEEVDANEIMILQDFSPAV